MRTLRNLARRRLRTSLTIAGITIGIWALVVFGSMANKIGALVEGGSVYYAGKVIVSDGSIGGFGGLPMRLALLEEIAEIPGVDVVVPTIATFAEPLVGGVAFGVPDQIVGSPIGADQGRETFAPAIAQGRELTTADAGRAVTVLGADIARKHGAAIGDTVTFHARAFEVVGVLEATLTTPDTSIAVPFDVAQEILHADLPAIVREQVRPEQLTSQFVVYPEPGTDVSALAAAIDARIEGASTMTGDQFDETIGSSIAVFNAMILGIGLISLIVGGLSIINTMAMSVAERTREIGIKRAIGAGRARIIRELISEAGVIGLAGGLLGLGLGALVVVLANEAGRTSGTVLFELTPGTALFALAFSTVLGIVAGIVPAWNAARLDPVAALRYE
jgi:putative ABC transport system permease protein